MADNNRIQELERLVQAANLRADEEQRRANEERRRADEEQRRADEEQRRADEEQRRADEEQRRADEEQRRADEETEQTRPTTLHEYIDACHHLIFSQLTIETDKSLTSTGTITDPTNKYCPTSLKPWPDFIKDQRIVFGELESALPAIATSFEPRAFLSTLGKRVSKRRIADEKDLELFLHNAVEDPVKNILERLTKVEQVRSMYNMGGGVVFVNHPHALSDNSQEVIEAESQLAPRTPDLDPISDQLRPDQICIYRSDGGPTARRNMVYVCEYKAPHKLTASHLRAGLRPMNIHRDVVNRTTIPTNADPYGHFQYHAEKLTAAALTQTYHYMIHGGLEYGLLTTGEAIVFLKVDWSEPSTLYYHLAEPKSEVAAHPDNFHSCTAVGQLLAFTLLALGPPGARRHHGQDERDAVRADLKTWTQDFETMLRSIPQDARHAPRDSPYKPTTYKDMDRSPYPRRLNRVPIIYDDSAAPPARFHSESESSDDDAGPSRLPATPSPAPRSTGGQTQAPRRSQRIQAQQRSASATQRSSAERTSQYCTQKCLVGLVRGHPLDASCPNVRLHARGQSTTRRHPVSHNVWLQLLTQQLRHSLDEGVIPLDEGGARGVMFQVTLLAYGYVFMCKGTVRAFIKHLQHEAAVYKRLGPLQGTSVPVCLGSVDLRDMNKIYDYDHRVYIVYLMFLSWGGHKLHQLPADVDTSYLADKTLQSLRALHRVGVVHKDVREPNLLYNSETKRVMIIDFERSVLVQQPSPPRRRALGELAPNRRQRSDDAKPQEKRIVAVGRDSRAVPVDAREDILMAKWFFSKLN
ncbi:hypothetical protein MY11210_000218 [Beauveria gryllotalpidicola]